MSTKYHIVKQPTAQSTMLPQRTGDLNALNLPFDETTKTRAWSYPLFSLSAPSTFALALLLPCVAYGRTASRRAHLDAHGAPHPTGGEACGGDCQVYGACCVLGGLCGGAGCLLLESRTQTRFRYRIGGGDGAGEVATAMCCAPCALTQEAREIELEEVSFAAGV